MISKTLTKLSIQALAIAATLALPNTADASDINVVKRGQKIPVCLRFSEYLKFHKAFKSGNKELANRIFDTQSSCIVLKEGLEYAFVDRNFRWAEIVIFNEGQSHTAYMIPFQGY